MDSKERASAWNLPNKLSVLRIIVSPILILTLYSPGRFLSALSAALFLAVSLTDWLDGYMARRMGVVTSLGKFLDPLADKLLIMTALIMLIPLERAPAWMVALIIGREVAITGLRAIASDEGVVIQASPLGKAKTVSQTVALVPLIMHYPFFGIDFQLIGAVILWIAFALTMYSGADYIVKFFREPSGAKK
jgi:CDP-diacylglycerol--glycerol-3-phosphate 3-phosphatidyltransferase